MKHEIINKIILGYFSYHFTHAPSVIIKSMARLHDDDEQIEDYYTWLKDYYTKLDLSEYIKNYLMDESVFGLYNRMPGLIEDLYGLYYYHCLSWKEYCDTLIEE